MKPTWISLRQTLKVLLILRICWILLGRGDVRRWRRQNNVKTEICCLVAILSTVPGYKSCNTPCVSSHEEILGRNGYAKKGNNLYVMARRLDCEDGKMDETSAYGDRWDLMDRSPPLPISPFQILITVPNTITLPEIILEEFVIL
jgi:hypothetical protein